MTHLKMFAERGRSASTRFDTEPSALPVFPIRSSLTTASD